MRVNIKAIYLDANNMSKNIKRTNEAKLKMYLAKLKKNDTKPGNTKTGATCTKPQTA